MAKTSNADDTYLKGELDKAAQAFGPVQKVKADETRLTDFETWTGKLEKAFNSYKNSESYENIKNIIEESVEKNKSAWCFMSRILVQNSGRTQDLQRGLTWQFRCLKGAQSLIDH